MITNFKKHSRKDDVKLLACIILGFLLLVWLLYPAGDKLSQLCFWGNNTKFIFAKIFHKSETSEYLFHRNNAIYLAKMYPRRTTAIKEMDKAIATLPSFASDTELKELYRDRAEIKLFLGDQKGALSDYVKSGSISFSDNLKVAMLFRTVGNYREAMTYCNAMLNQDPTAYAGFACISNIYISVGRPDVALNVWNLAIDRNKNNSRAYVDRALVKKSLGDFTGYDNDIKLAKEFSPGIDIESSIIEDALHPKMLTLSIR